MRWYGSPANNPDSWTELANGFVPMDHQYRDPEIWTAALTAQETAVYRLLRWDQRGLRTCNRTRTHVRDVPGDDFYWIVIPEQGVYSMRFGDDVMRVPPGTATVTGLDVACRLHIPESRAIAFQVPRTEIDHRLQPRGPMRVVVDMTRGLGRIANDMILSTHAEQADLSDRDFNAVCDRITELLCMVAIGDTQPLRADHAEVAESIRRYVRKNIGRSDVRLPAVAHALGWSPRQLRVVLQESGTTFRDVRRDEALRTARELLEDPHATSSIRDLATRCGFTPSWFSAAFKERFGQAPREFRRRRLAEIADQRP
jgi:AraC-like DNA-binding protein